MSHLRAYLPDCSLNIPTTTEEETRNIPIRAPSVKKKLPRVDQLRTASDWQPRNPVSMETASAAPRGLARGLLWMGWRHGAGARESAPKTEQERGERGREENQGRRERGRERQGWGCCRWRFARLCTDVLLRHFITCLSAISQAKCSLHSCGSERKTGRKWKNPIAPDVDTDCRSSRLY